MKANELRIGNWISDRGGKQWQINHWESKNKVSAKEPEFNTHGMLLRGHSLTEYVDYLQPIPLTEEWLVRFGFTKVQSLREDHCNYSIDIIKRNSKSHYFPNLVWYQKKGFTLKNIYIGYDLKYVHQLQNLYFALTGEELELK